MERWLIACAIQPFGVGELWSFWCKFSHLPDEMAKTPDKIPKVHDEASKVHDETLKVPYRKQITHVKNSTTSSSDVLPHPKAEERTAFMIRLMKVKRCTLKLEECRLKAKKG